MIAVNENGRIVIVTSEVPETFCYVPKAMIEVLKIAIESDIFKQRLNESLQDYIGSYLGFIQDIIPENYEGMELERINTALETYQQQGT